MMKPYHIRDESDGMYYAGGPNWVADTAEAAVFMGAQNAADMIQTIRSAYDELGDLAAVAAAEQVVDAAAK